MCPQNRTQKPVAGAAPAPTLIAQAIAARPSYYCPATNTSTKMTDSHMSIL